MANYCTLEVGKRYLKNFDALAADPQNGITQADLTECEESANRLIDMELGELFSAAETATWATSPPPLIEAIAFRLASAEAILIKFSRDGIGKPQDLVDSLKADAREMLDKIKTGSAVLKDVGGDVINPQVSRQPRVQNREDQPFSGGRWKRNQYSDGR